MTIFFDIDNFITFTEGTDYKGAKPNFEVIAKCNRAYDAGHYIIYWTARGTGSGINWVDLTTRQFKEWGVKYHELRFGKPIYDLFCDDKNMSTEEWLTKDDLY